MANIAIIYWSSTGNTEKMADEIAKHVLAGGNTPELIEASNFTADLIGNFDALIFGCPACGTEELDDSVFLPMWDDVKTQISDKKVALFGSFGWGGGEWMQTWKEDCAANSVEVIDTVICNGEPDDEALKACKALAGKF